MKEVYKKDLDQNKVAAAVFIDLEKAFHSTQRDIQINKYIYIYYRMWKACKKGI